MATQQTRDARNASLIAAEAERSRATRAAELEYSRTVDRLRARFEADLAAAAARRLAAVRPHHRAYNVAVVAAERLAAERLAARAAGGADTGASASIGPVRIIDAELAHHRPGDRELVLT